MRIQLLSLLGCAALSAMAQESYVVTTVDLSPMGQDYAPVITDSSVVMCSLRDRGGLVSYRNAETDDPFSDLYRFSWNGTSAGTPTLLSEGLTSPLNDGPASFTMDGSTICFTRNMGDEKGKGAQRDKLGLFFSAHIDGNWTPPVAFPYNSEAYNVMHAAFSPDGTRLYFASDMPGGEGGTDLYCSVLGGDGWEAPRNLGRQVNGPTNELFPFVAQDGTLYFSSDRNGGAGKLDIYQCLVHGKAWKSPEALPAPINSAGNDIGYTSFRTDRSGFFSSDRSGTDRIYAFRLVVPYFTDCAAQQDNNYCYAFHQPDLQKIGDLPLHHAWNMGDGTTLEGAAAQHCYKGPGRYHVQLDLVDNASGFVFFNEANYDLVIDDIHQPYITCADTLRSGRKEPLDASHTYLPGASLEEYHWDFGDGTTAEGPVVTHDWSAPGDYMVKLAVLSVPDGTRLVRSNCVTRTVHVIKHFEDTEDAPVLASYQDASGATHDFNYQTLPSDQFSMTVQDNEDVRFSVQLFASKERLSLDDPSFAEIRKFYPVFERYDPVRGEYTYSVGQAKDLASMYEVYKKVLELKFLDGEVVAIHPDKVTDLSALALLNEQDLNNSVVRASTVLFDNGKASIRKEFEPQLDKLLQLLNEHPQLSVVIEAHTDANGGPDYNLKLSQQRAQSIMDYLAAKGTRAERMVPVGHGENHPIADNGTADGRAQNRRVEFRLVMREDQAYEKRK